MCQNNKFLNILTAIKSRPLAGGSKEKRGRKRDRQIENNFKTMEWNGMSANIHRYEVVCMLSYVAKWKLGLLEEKLRQIK